MLKLIKYELRKDMTLYIVIFSILFALELYLGGSILCKSDANVAISMILFLLCGWAGIIFLMIMGVVSYARELNSKYSYMTFMTPNSTYAIVGAKYLTLFIVTVLASALYILFIYADVQLAMVKYGNIRNMREMADQILEIMAGTNISDIIIGIAAVVLGIWINIILTVSFAYLAITLSATILANKKGKGWLAFGLFVVIRVVTAIASYHIPTFDFGDSFVQTIAGSWLVYLFEILFIIGTYIGVSELLKRKVSL